MQDDDDLLGNHHSDDDKFELKTEFSDSDDPENDDISKLSPKKLHKQVLFVLSSLMCIVLIFLQPVPLDKKPEALPRRKSSAGPSGRSKTLANKHSNSSDSDVSDSERNTKKLAGEYDPRQFENLQVDAEIAEVFEYITR